MLYSDKYVNYKADNMSHDMRFPTIWYMRLENAQINLRIRAV